MKFFLSALLLLSNLTAAQLVPTKMSHEETVVRNSYARLSYAVGQLPIIQMAEESQGVPVPRKAASLSSEARITNGELIIGLSDFVVGDAAEILDRKVDDLITADPNWKLSVNDLHHSYASHGEMLVWWEPQASWQHAVAPAPTNTTVRSAFESIWQVKLPNPLLERYASYSVTVKYDGKTVGAYRALFLFGHDKGNEFIQPQDNTIDQSALGSAMYEHLLADALVASDVRDVPAVSRWVSGKKQSLNCFESQGVCCDPVKVSCGPAEAVIQKALAAPVRRRVQ